MESIVQEYLNNNCGFLSKEEILTIDKNDNGAVSNVIRKLCPHSMGIWLENEKPLGEYHLFYINNEVELTGLICRLDFLHILRNDVTYAFSCLINKYFPVHTRLLRTFNNYQTQTITLAEKFGYITYGDGLDRSQVNVDDPKFIHIPLCNKIEALKNIFNHTSATINKGEKNDYIYLMYNSRNDLTKIGRSINPLSREKTLQGEDPELGMIAVWKEDRIYEKILHKKFYSKRKRGEWFDLDTSDFLTIKNYMIEKSWL